MPTTFSIHGYVLEAMLNFTVVPRGVATSSVLSNVLVEMTQDSLRLIATNSQVMGILHITAMHAYGLQIRCASPQSIVIPVNELKPLIRDKRYPQLQVTIDGFSITAKNSAGMSATVLGRAPAEFPVYRATIPREPAKPISSLAVDAAQLVRFVSFAKALGIDAQLTLGFHGDARPFTVRIKHLSAFYGTLMPAALDQVIEAPVWLAQQHESPVEGEVLCDGIVPSHLPPVLPIETLPISSEKVALNIPACDMLPSTSALLITPRINQTEIARPQSAVPAAAASPANLAVGQMVTFQGKEYPVIKVDGDWVNLDTSLDGKHSWRTVRQSLLTNAPDIALSTAPLRTSPPEEGAETSIATVALREISVEPLVPTEQTGVSVTIALPETVKPLVSEIDTVLLARQIYTHLNSGEDYATKRELHKFIAGVLGVDPVSITQAINRLMIDPRALDEAYEYAQVLRARDLARNTTHSHEETLQRFIERYQQQLPVSQRDTTVKQHQQYSTPLPLCYLIGRYLGLTQEGLYYEPTAGNGSLLISADPKTVIVNELDAGPRLLALKDQGFKQVLDVDALSVPETHPELLGQMDAVVMNPPFQTLEKPMQYHGYKISKLEHLIALRSLELMKDHGRAAIIIGGHNFFDRFGQSRKELPACDAVFFNYLYAHYHVAGNIDVNGDLYGKQGTTFPVRVLLIEGRNRKPIEGYAAPRLPSQVQRAMSWIELDHLLIPPERKSGLHVDQREDDRKHRVPIGTLETEQAGVRSDGNITNNDEASSVSTDLISMGQQVTGWTDVAINTPVQQGAMPSIHSNEYQATYEPVSRHPGKVEYLSPKNLTEPQRTALLQIKVQHGGIDAYLQRELGYHSLVDELYQAFHAAQIDGIALALSNLSRGGGMIIGDGTGVGKGREAAAIISWAKQQGKFPIFFTQNPKLFSDIYSDLRDIGKPLTPFIMNSGIDAHIVDTHGKILVRAEGSRAIYQQIESLGVNAPILKGCDFLVVNYPQINRDNVQRKALQSLAQGNIILLDESHNASGDSGTGQFIRDNLLKTASGVLYLSATYAKRPNTMPLYYRTDLGNAGLSLPQLIEAIEKGGVALQQVIAADLAKAGQYIRREMDFSQVEYYKVVIDYAHEARDLERSDRVTEILRDIVQFDIAKAELVEAMHQQAKKEGRELGKIDGTKTTSAGVTSTNFTATVHNIISQMLLSIKADTVVDRAIAAIQHPDSSQRKKVVIGLMNTLESHLKALIDAGDLSLGQQVRQYSFKEVLKKALRNTLRYRVKDHTGNATAYQFNVPGVYLANTKIGMRLDPVSEEMFFDLLAKIERMQIDLSGSPIDSIIHRMRTAGLRVGELTGRTYTFDAHGTLTARTGSEKNKNTLVNAFNNGELDVLIINSAGATGLSIHSAPKFKDQAPRLMLVPQSQLNIDTELQLYGRINRTGQVNGPAFEIMQTALPSEIRPAAILQGKMASINANTSANDESHFSLKEIPDMMNKYGDEIVQTYLKENPDVYAMIGEPEPGEMAEHGAYFRKVSGRIALAPVAIQRAFYEAVERRYKRTIAYLDQMGTNDLVTKNYDFQAKTIFRLKTQEGIDESNPFKSSVYVEEVSAKVLAKPYLRARVERDANASKRSSDKVVMEALQRGQDYLAALHRKSQSLDLGNVTDLTNRIVDIEENLRTLETFSIYYQVGNTYALSLGEGRGDQHINGVLISLSHDYDPKKDLAKNPVMPSSFGALFYLPDSRQEITIPLSQREERIGRIVQEGIPDSWDEEIPTGDREIRYLTTGNILQAMGGDNGFTGSNLIKYTTNTGEHKFGILWPEGTKREEIIRRYASYGGSADSAAKYLHSDKIIYTKEDKKHGRKAILFTTAPAQIVYYPDMRIVELRILAGVDKSDSEAILYSSRILSLLRQHKFIQKQTGWLGIAESQDLLQLLRALENATPTKYIIPRESVIDEINADIARAGANEMLEVLDHTSLANNSMSSSHLAMSRWPRREEDSSPESIGLWPDYRPAEDYHPSHLQMDEAVPV